MNESHVHQCFTVTECHSVASAYAAKSLFARPCADIAKLITEPSLLLSRHTPSADCRYSYLFSAAEGTDD